ncbi:MAG: type II secretion system protein [Planctomycetota bacterium]|jgi:prepilin-type N-terminal cleavage/methylation domain-containing protein
MRKKTGFTLIEVLVVVAIIALLASILIPSLSAARRSAKTVKCKHNLHQIGVAMEAYLHKYKDYFPMVCRLFSQELQDHSLTPAQYYNPNATIPGDFHHPLPVVLERETSKNVELFECPEDFVDPEDASNYLAGGLNIRDRYFISEKTSYEWNDFLSDEKYPRRRRHNWIQLITEDLETGNVIIYARIRPCDLFIVNDYDSFHSSSTGVRNCVNYLYADMSVRSVY